MLIINNDGTIVTSDVSSVKTYNANSSEENRIKFVTDCTSVCRGKERCKNPESRYNSLLKEAALGTVSRTFEFLPVYLDNKNTIKILDILGKNKENRFGYASNNTFNSLFRFSFVDEDRIYTNMRTLLNAGVPYESIPYNTPDEIMDFKVIKIKVPMFVWSQLMTHTMISKLSQSDRTTEESDYWLPRDLIFKFIAYTGTDVETINLKNKLSKNNYSNDENNHNELIQKSIIHKAFLEKLPQKKIQQILRDELKYPREIWSRAPYYFKFKQMKMAGWYNDPYVWKHFLIERGVMPELWKNWTQKETKEVCNNIKICLERYNDVSIMHN